MNNDRVNQINSFLNALLSYSKTQPIDYNLVYNNLIDINVPEEYKKVRVDEFFPAWINYFNERNVPMIEDDEKLFLACYNNDFKIRTGESPSIKMYVPLKKDYLFEGFKQIVDFLNSNNIAHQSKVSRFCRFDNIVLRIENKEDALLVEEFLKRNSLIQKGLISPNPFAISSNNIAHVSDSLLSYNSILSNIIIQYTEHIKNSSVSKEASLQGLRLFVNDIYQRTFITGEKILDLESNYYSNSYCSRVFTNATDYISNYMEVIELIMLSLNPSKDIKDYYNHYNNLIDNNTKQIRLNYITDLINKQKYQKSISPQMDSNVEISEQNESISSFVSALVDAMIKKYGFDIALARFTKFYNEKDVQYITNDNNWRVNLDARLIEFLHYFATEFKNNPIDLFNYVKLTKLNKKAKDKEAALRVASMKTYAKYVLTNKSPLQLITALQKASEGDYELFTNDNYARQNLVIKVKPNEINELIISVLKDNNIEIENSDKSIYELYNDYIANKINELNFYEKKVRK